MSYKTITIRRIYVVGQLWVGGKAAYSYTVKPGEIELLTRENCEKWLSIHSGDFQCIDDFRVDIEDFESDWENEGSEIFINDCMFGGE